VWLEADEEEARKYPEFSKKGECGVGVTGFD